MGLTIAEEAARLSEAEILDFIFRPGFSTAEQVTEVSGRGVGMDVVQSVLHRLKGIGQRGDASRTRHHVPPEAAADAGHHQSLAVLGGAAAVRDPAERCAGDRAHLRSRSASGRQLRSAAVARPGAAAVAPGTPRLPTAIAKPSFLCSSSPWQSGSTD